MEYLRESLPIIWATQIVWALCCAGYYLSRIKQPAAQSYSEENIRKEIALIWWYTHTGMLPMSAAYLFPSLFVDTDMIIVLFSVMFVSIVLGLILSFLQQHQSLDDPLCLLGVLCVGLGTSAYGIMWVTTFWVCVLTYILHES